MKTSPVLKAAFFSVLLVIAGPASACLNGYEPNEADVARSENLVEQLTQHHLLESWTNVRDWRRWKLENGSAETSPTYQLKNDLAVALLHTGETQEAIRLLQEVETEHPGAYQTAANLGTAYELAGDNANGLKWIEEGVKRNPDSHGGSEWIHVAILKAKINNTNPKWLQEHSILGFENILPPPGQFTPLRATLPSDTLGRPRTLDQCIKDVRIHARAQCLGWLANPRLREPAA